MLIRYHNLRPSACMDARQVEKRLERANPDLQRALAAELHRFFGGVGFDGGADRFRERPFVDGRKT